MKFLSDILAKAGLTVDGVVTLNNTATGQTPDANDNSTKLATTAWVRTFVQPYSLPIASASTLGGIKVGAGLSINPTTGVLTASSGISTRDVCIFIATAGQTTFSCSYTVDQVDVFYNGSKLGASEFTATNGTSVVLNTACKVNDYVEIVSWVAGAGLSTSRTITIDGVTQDLTANRTWNILPTGGAAGDILAKVSGTNYDVTWIPNYTSTVQHTVKAAVAVTKGQAVYISSADGTNMIVSKASNASEGTSSKTLGLVAQDLAINGQGFVVTEGLLTGLDTSTATAGDPVWLGTNGNLIFGLLNKPTAPAHLVFIGVVTRVQQNNGEIFVKVQNGFEMSELHDYVQSGVQDNFVISYESSTSLYKPKSIATLLGYTPANAARSLTINGTSYDLTADRTWTLTTSNITEGTNLYYTDTRVGTYLTANSYATQSYVSTQINNLVSGAPGLLDTLDELAAALGDDPNFATTVSTALSNRLRIDIGTQGLTSTQQGYGRTNLGLGSLATLSSVANANITDLAYSKLTGVPSTFAPSAHTHVWTDITDRPTNLSAFTNGPGYLTGITSSQVTTALGYTPYNSTNPSGYITGITSSNVTTALGYTPYNSTNPNGYISSYTETDTLSSVTGRGATTSSALSLNGKVTFSSAVVSRPQMPGGILGLDTGDGNFDIWGISRDYYPSHATAANAWGLRWNGDNNDFEFVGGGTSRVILDMDGGNITATGTLSASGYNKTNWDTAYSWGNHASAGYITSSALSPYLLKSGGTMSGQLTLSSISGTDQMVENNYGAYLHLGNWGVGRTATDAVLVNTAYRADYATDLFDMNISRFTNNSGYITSSGRAYPRRSDGNDLNFYWSGQSGQPTWLWGGNDGANMYVYNPSNFSVSYASSAGNADTVDSLHASSFVRNDTTGQYLKPYYEYGNYLTSQTPADIKSQFGGTGGLRVDFMHPSYAGGGSWNHVITWSGYQAYNMYQLGGYYDGGTSTNLYVRSEANHGNTSWTSWRRLLNTSSDPYAANMDQYVRTSDSPSFSNLYISNAYAGGDLRGNDVYTTGGWFRNHTNSNGIYWSSTGFHLYPKDGSDFYVRSGNPDISIQFMAGGGTSRNYIHNASDNAIGFLSTGRSWILRVENGGRLQAYGPIARNDHASGFLEGSYNNIGGNSTYTNPIYTIGSSYNPSNSSLNSMYGIGYSHPNFWGSGKVGGWGMYVCSAGIIDAIIGGDGSSTSIWAKTDIVAYSDARVKENVQVIENALEKVQAIRGVTFTRNDVKDKEKRSAGVIAQEVLAVMPEVVTGTEKDMYSVAYGNMAGLFIEAIKELKAENDALKEILKRNNII